MPKQQALVLTGPLQTAEERALEISHRGGDSTELLRVSLTQQGVGPEVPLIAASPDDEPEDLPGQPFVSSASGGRSRTKVHPDITAYWGKPS